MVLLVVSILAALTVSFLCSIMEASLLSLTPGQMADLSARKPAIGLIWQGFKANIEKPIAVILILNTAAHTIGATVAGSEFKELFGDKWIWAFALAFTAVMVQFTEILPKTLGVRFNRELAGVMARPLSAAILVFTPLLKLIHRVNRPVEIKGNDKEQRQPPTVEEISALAGLARLSREISVQQEKIIKGASRLSWLTAREVMIPTEQVSFLSTSQDISRALIAAHMDAHTRFPVCVDDDRDRVAGYVNFKEMVYFMRTNPNDPSLQGVIRPIYFVGPDDRLSSILESFVSQHIHMAMVRDSLGKTLGMITMEDLVEELVGELEDEFDRLPRMLHALSGDVWMIGGGVHMSEVCQQTGFALPATQETVSAWLGQRLGQVPRPGDVYREAGAEFVVRRTRRARVFEINATRLKDN